MSTELRELHLRGALGAVRVEKYDGRDHMIVPVVALMDSVIHAVNAPHSERVPLECLQRAAATWNGRPLTLGHPTRNGSQISANDPRVLESQSFGRIFNSRVQGGKLLMDAYIDIQKAEAIGGQRMLEKLRNGQMCEVSVGAFVKTLAEAGEYNGKKYKAVWQETLGDHLAFLPDGVGACSIEMGCGAHRAASAALVGVYEVTDTDFRALYNPDQPRDEDGKFSGGGPGSGGGGKKLKGETANTRQTSSGAFRYHTVDSKGNVVSKHMTKFKARQYAKKHANETGDRVATVHSKTDKMVGEDFFDMVGYLTGSGSFKKNRVLTRLLRAAGLYDSPQEAVTEEVAELVRWNAMLDLCDQLGQSYDAVEDLIDQLVEAEAVHATGADEVAEAEIEAAKLDAIRVMCMGMYGTLNGIMNLANLSTGTGNDPSSVTPHYLEKVRAALGKKMGARDLHALQLIEKLDLSLNGRQLVEATAPVLESLAKYTDCVACKGSGEKDGNPCDACDGVGEIKTAEATGDPVVDPEEDNMNKQELIKKITGCPCSGFTEADAKVLEGFTEERLTALAASADARKKTEDDLRAAADSATTKATELETKVKALEAPQTEEEYLAKAPASIRDLVARDKALQAAEKTALVEQLKTAAAGTFTEDELKAKSVDDLRKLAALAKVEVKTVDYSGRGVPHALGANDKKDDFTPPNAYEKDLKALQGTAAN